MKQFLSGLVVGAAIMAVPVAAQIDVKKVPMMHDWEVWLGGKPICQGIVVTAEAKKINCIKPYSD